MSNPFFGPPRNKTRAARVAAHVTYTGNLAQILSWVNERDIRYQTLLVTLTVFAMCTVTTAWNPPQEYQESDIPERDIIARVPFDMETGQILRTPRYGDELDSVQVEESKSKIVHFSKGDILVRAQESITGFDFAKLNAEHKAYLKTRQLSEQCLRFLGVFLITLSMAFVAAVFLRRHERRKPRTNTGLLYFGIMMVVTTVLAAFLHTFEKMVDLELIPILLFAECIGIAYSWELSLIVTLIISFVVTVSHTNSIYGIVLILGVTTAVVINLGRLRSRTKLIMIGSFGAVVAFVLTLCIFMVEDRPLNQDTIALAGMTSLWTIATGFLMTGLLPFIERPFGILTDMSLLELSDPSHPLLHELIQRAPSTYNHSVQVGSIAEAAAETIGARGLLIRVGAYFHDIGKMLNPNYFTENQVGGANVHDALEPRMSTLVIVSHVKDGVNLARQHKIPLPIIQLIEQHHGTSLVSYFYGAAVKQNREQGFTNPVEEGSYRYPGPKPQTKEAGILMLADAAESACRSLGDAPPGKIEGMVRSIAEQKLKDGQFDDSGLTLSELRVIENSIIKSLLAIRHSRIRYPDHEEGKSSPEIKTSESKISDTKAKDSDPVLDKPDAVKSKTGNSQPFQSP
ncbi:MAG: HDIG domain-containing protein [Planctomycetaceae bacterium]|jgi:putative nucleotidyltransferase with HDIG domain|nr:HDIG domain-containing protein [Planctomycetaceae bacterium]